MRPSISLPLPSLNTVFPSLDAFKRAAYLVAANNAIQLRVFVSTNSQRGFCELRCNGTARTIKAKGIPCTCHIRAAACYDGRFKVIQKDDSHSCQIEQNVQASAAAQQKMATQLTMLNNREEREADERDEDDSEEEEEDKERPLREAFRTHPFGRNQPATPEKPRRAPDVQREEDVRLRAASGKYPTKTALLEDIEELLEDGDVVLPPPEQAFASIDKLLVPVYAYLQQNVCAVRRREQMGQVEIACRNGGCPVYLELLQGEDGRWRLMQQNLEHAPPCTALPQVTPTVQSSTPESKPLQVPQIRPASPLPFSLPPSQRRRVDPAPLPQATPRIKPEPQTDNGCLPQPSSSLSRSVQPSDTPTPRPAAPSTSKPLVENLKAPSGPPRTTRKRRPTATQITQSQLAAFLVSATPTTFPSKAQDFASQLIRGGLSAREEIIAFLDFDSGLVEALVEEVALDEGDEAVDGLLEVLTAAREAWIATG
ncbi:hypothetical protein JCM8097_002581 [Rhodosporidiobolus ruineniae]